MGKIIFSFFSSLLNKDLFFSFSFSFSLLLNKLIVSLFLFISFFSSFSFLLLSASGVGVRVANKPKSEVFIDSFFSSFLGVGVFSFELLLLLLISPNKVLSLFSILFNLSILPKSLLSSFFSKVLLISLFFICVSFFSGMFELNKLFSLLLLILLILLIGVLNKLVLFCSFCSLVLLLISKKEISLSFFFISLSLFFLSKMNFKVVSFFSLWNDILILFEISFGFMVFLIVNSSSFFINNFFFLFLFKENLSGLQKFKLLKILFVINELFIKSS